MGFPAGRLERPHRCRPIASPWACSRRPSPTREGREWLKAPREVFVRLILTGAPGRVSSGDGHIIPDAARVSQEMVKDIHTYFYYARMAWNSRHFPSISFTRD